MPALEVDCTTALQLDLLRGMSRLDPAPYLFGGYAEDALLAGKVTRPHLDVDWLCPRRELDLRLAQARELGFSEFETWGESAPGEPFYLFAQQGDLRLDLGVGDELDGHNVLRVHNLAFAPVPVPYRVALPDDMFDHPPVTLEGIELRVVSPLALHQIRTGIASQGSFGELSDRHLAASRQLCQTFYPGVDPAALAPAIDPI